MGRAGSALSVPFFLILALTGMPMTALADGQFLGLAVARAISQDDAGRIMLEGIHHASRAEEFPHTEAVCVYTRWDGSGSHEIGVSIWNMDTEETVTESTREIEFSPDTVTTFVQTFPHATFPQGGTYAVEVTLDGDLAAEYSLFVNVDDSYPDTPELVLSVPAEKGSLDQAGNASVDGIPALFAFPRFPAHDSFDLVTLWFSGEGSHEQRIEILDPTGVPIASSAPQAIRSGYGKLQLLTDSFRDVPLAVRGTYTAVLYLDGEDVFEYPLPVRRE
ncbi:MAG: hypothetical protein ABSG17_14245 [Spirochaetia bacterium]